MKRTVGLKRTAFMRTKRLEDQAAQKFAKTAKAPMKSRGMKGRAPTAGEREFMDKIASLGCLACATEGITNPWISLHHIAGRTAPGAHMLVLGLCAPHHQHDDTDPRGRIGVHPHKARFEQRYGTQLELLANARRQLGIEEEATC